MQFRIYDRQTLAYKDGGYVANYIIDDDYIVNNNSTIHIVRELNNRVVVGDTIALIKTSGAYHKGTITTFDNADLTITYKSDKELFNDNMLNPLLGKFTNEESAESSIAARFGIADVANILTSYFANANDWARRLPIKIITEGEVTGTTISLEKSSDSKVSLVSFNRETYEKRAQGIEKLEFYYRSTSIIPGWGLGVDEGEFRVVNLADYGISTLGTPKENDKIITQKSVAMFWTWSNDSINVVDWLIELFKNYNISLSWTIDFDMANEDVNERQPYYIVTLSAITSTGKIIKDNVKMQTITYTERKLPESTVCVVLDEDTKEVLKLNESTKNLLNPYLSEQNKYLSVSLDFDMVQTKDDETSDISGYIKLDIDNTDIKDGVKVTTYTFSCNNYDNKERHILFYDAGKKLVSWKDKGINSISYSSTNGSVSTTFWLNDTNVAFCRVCYDNRATEVQLEKGGNKTEYEGWNIPAIYYLCEKNGSNYVSIDADEHETINEDGQVIKKSLRVFPAKTTVVKYKTSDENNVTPQQTAENTLIPSRFNQAIEIQIHRDSKMFDFNNTHYGDVYTIINEHGKIQSNFTGRKEDSSTGWITLYFGLGRQTYTDIMQLRMQKQKYDIVYN